MASSVSYVLGPVGSVATAAASASGGWSGASGGGRWPTSHTRPLPKTAAVPTPRIAFLMNSRRRRYSASGVISLLDGSGASVRTGGVYAPPRQFNYRNFVGQIIGHHSRRAGLTLVHPDLGHHFRAQTVIGSREEVLDVRL